MSDLPPMILADPAAPTRATIAAMLSPYFAIQEAASLQDTYQLLRAEGRGLLVLGLEQPDGEGLGFLPMLREAWPASQICIACYSDRHEISTKTLAFRRGADDYVDAPQQVSPFYAYRLRILWRLSQESAHESLAALADANRAISRNP